MVPLGRNQPGLHGGLTSGLKRADREDESYPLDHQGFGELGGYLTNVCVLLEVVQPGFYEGWVWWSEGADQEDGTGGLGGYLTNVRVSLEVVQPRFHEGWIPWPEKAVQEDESHTEG